MDSNTSSSSEGFLGRAQIKCWDNFDQRPACNWRISSYNFFDIKAHSISSVNATNCGLDGVYTIWGVESRRVVIQLRTSNLVFAK